MQVILAENAGTCYGVERALNIAHKVSQDAKRTACVDNIVATNAHKVTSSAHKVASDAQFQQVNTSNSPNPCAQTLGPIIHNPRVVAQLEREGISVANTLEDITAPTVILRSHGVLPHVREQLKQTNVRIEDATCPYVLRAQKAAYNLAREHGCVIVVGDAGHPEVEGLIAYARLGCDNVVVATSALDLYAHLPSQLPRCLGVVVQTTQSEDTLGSIIDALDELNITTDVKNTICSATTVRQISAATTAKEVDAMVVIGGKNSSNTTRLFQICKNACSRSFHIESPHELAREMFADCESVGVTAGASTPQNQIDEVVDLLKKF